MKIGWTGMTVLLGASLLISCGGISKAPDAGDVQAGDEPAEGGIKEVPNPSPAMAKKSGKPLGQLQRGHEVYMLHCGECHHYKLPQDLDIDEWQESVPKMIGHAGLEHSDETAVLDYVVAVKQLRGE